MDRHARCVQSVDTVLPGHGQGVPADRGASAKPVQHRVPPRGRLIAHAVPQPSTEAGAGISRSAVSFTYPSRARRMP